MAVALITGSSGLIGSEASRFFHEMGFDVVGIDNDLRSHFFGKEASTEWNTAKLKSDLRNFRHLSIDVRDQEKIFSIVGDLKRDLAVVVHAAAQPSHDWAANDPFMDFSVNAMGTLVMLEAVRHHAPGTAFIFTSTNKVYGDTPNRFPLRETATRWELDSSHPFFEFGVDESMSIDQSMHSVFGASKVAADVMVQEYGRYFGLKTGVFRGGCLTGPAHSGAELHGFLAYLVKCTVTGRPYSVFGYKGKQVRDNIHSHDLVSAFWEFYRAPKSGVVYNIGGSRFSNCSVLEAIGIAEELSGKKLRYEILDGARGGDHIWWISDIRRFRNDYPNWNLRHDLRSMISEIVDAVRVRSRNS